MYPEKLSSRERVQLMNDWSAHIDGGYTALSNFLTNSFGLAARRWSGNDSFPMTLADNVVAETVDRVIAECKAQDMKPDDFSFVIGHRYLSRRAPAFHNYTVEQVRDLIPRIARLWREATDEAVQEAMERQRDDDLLAYFMHIDEGVPLDYARTVVG